MNERVKELLENKLQEEEAKKQEKMQEEETKKQEKREALLLKLGLYDVEYSPYEYHSPEYPFFDSEAGKYYKKNIIEISDEDYQELLNHFEATEEHGYQNIIIATVIRIISAIVFLGGFIMGIVCGNVEISGLYTSYTRFSPAIAFTYWGISLISGFILLGFAQIIQTLDNIYTK